MNPMPSASSAGQPSAAQKASLSATLIAMQEMERRRIAADLHDSIGQSLSTVCFGLGAAVDSVRKGNVQSAGEMLERLATQVRQTIVEVQRIAMDLRPAMLEDVGLVGTLSWFLREFRSAHAGLAVTADIGFDEGGVAPALCTDIYRIVQESLSNVAKHSGASEVHVCLRRVQHEIHLEVADNGTGFTMKGADRSHAPGSGFGLKGMRERAELSGGRISLVSVPGQGTRILVTWPVPAR